MKALGIVAVVIIILLGGWYFYANRGSMQYTTPQPSPSPVPPPALTPPTPQSPPPSSMKPKEVVVNITASGFSPSEVKIKAGDTVKFVNKDNKKRWPASGVHPSHQICPGFDAIGGINPDQSYSFTFKEIKTCPMHDHLLPTQFGKIIVE